MAIARNALLTSTAVTSPGATTITGSVTNTANALLLLAICTSKTGGATGVTPSGVTGLSLTWVQVATTNVGNVCKTVFRAQGASTTGTLTITWAGTPDGAIYQLDEFTGVETGGTNGSAAIVQSGTSAANTTTPTVTLTSTPRVNSVIYAATNHNDSTATASAGTNMTALLGAGTTVISSAPTQHQAVGWDTAASPNAAIAFSFTAAGNSPMVALEITVPGYRTIVSAGGNWSATGTWAEGSVPTSSENVVAVAGSGQLTIDVAAACRSIDLTNYVNTLTHNSGFTLTVGDASGGTLKFVAGMTYTKGSTTTSAISFASTSTNGGAGWPITPASKVLGNVSFNGVGGKWTLQGALSADGSTSTTLTLTNGTLDTNGQAVSVGVFNSNNANTRTMTLGSSAVTITGSNVAVNVNTITGLTWSSNTATFTLTNSSVTVQFVSGFNTNGTSFTFNATGVSATLLVGTIANLTFSPGASQVGVLRFQSDVTITGTFTGNGNSVTNRIWVRSSSNAGLSQRTVTAAAVSMSNIDFMDIIGAGAANWNLSASSAGDAGGNSGITFTTPKSCFFRSAGANWSNVNSWSNTSGGGPTGTVPLCHDTAVLDASSGSPTVTVDCLRACKDLTCTGFTGTLNMQTGISGHNIFGNITLASGMTFSNTQVVDLWGRGSPTITMAGKSFGNTLSFQGPGSWTFQDAFSSTAGVSNNNAAGIDTNSQPVTMSTFTNLSSGSTITLGTSTVTLTSTASGSIWNMIVAPTLSAASSTIVISTASANNRTFAGGSLTYGTLTYTVAASAGSLIITGSNTFTTINVSGGSKILTLTTATTTTVTNFNVSGSAPGPNILNANTSGIETDATGWANVNETTLAQTAVQARTGTKSLQMTKNATVQTYMSIKTSAGFAVTPGETYTCVAYFRAATVARSCTVWLDWKDGSSVHIGGPGVSVTNTTSGWTAVTVTGIAPANAATAWPSLQVNSVALNEVHYADDISEVLTNIATLNSSVGGSTTTNLVKAGGGQVLTSYLSVVDSQASPTTTWYDAPGGVDAGNNTGWNFIGVQQLTTSSIATSANVSSPQLNLAIFPSSIVTAANVPTDSIVQLKLQFLTMSSIVTAANVPSPQVNLAIFPGSIITAANVPSPSVQFTVGPTSIVTAESVPSATILGGSFPQSVTAVSITTPLNSFGGNLVTAVASKGNQASYGGNQATATKSTLRAHSGRGMLQLQVPRDRNVLTTNQASLETDTTGWIVNINCTIARSTVAAADGSASLLMTATAAATAYCDTLIGTSGFPVFPNTTYRGLFSFRTAVGTNRFVGVYISWYDSGGAFISSSSTGGNTATASFQQIDTGAVVSPSNAAYGALNVQLVNPAISDAIYVDKAQVVTGSGTTWAAGDSYRLLEATHPGTGTSAFPVSPNATYRAEGWAWQLGSAAGSQSQVRSAQMKIWWYDAAGVFLTALNTGSQTLSATGWTQLTGTMVAPANAAFATLVCSVSSSVNMLPGELFYFDDLKIEPTFGLAMYLPGVAGSYVSIPSVAAFNPSADTDIRWYGAPSDWSPTGTQTFVGKWLDSTDRGYVFRANSSGGLGAYFSTTGADVINIDSTANHGFVDGSAHWIRVTRVAATGVVAFYTSTDGVTWTPLGTTVTGTAGALFASTQPLQIGAYNGSGGALLAGNTIRAEVHDGIDGPTAAVFDVRDVTPTAVRTPATIGNSGTAGGTWTFNGTGWFWNTYAQASDLTFETDGPYLTLVRSVGGWLTTPDTAALDITGDVDLRAKIRCVNYAPGGGQYQCVMAKDSFPTEVSYWLRINEFGAPELAWSANGTTVLGGGLPATATFPSVGILNSQDVIVRAVLDVNNGNGQTVTHYYYATEDNGPWRPLGVPVVTSGVTSVYSGTAALKLGAMHASLSHFFDGRVYWAEVRNGINGDVVAAFNAAHVAIASSTSPTTASTMAGATWTLNGTAGTAWSWKADTMAWTGGSGGPDVRRSTVAPPDGCDAFVVATCNAESVTNYAEVSSAYTSSSGIAPGERYSGIEAKRVPVPLSGRTYVTGKVNWNAVGGYVSEMDGGQLRESNGGAVDHWCIGGVEGVAPVGVDRFSVHPYIGNDPLAGEVWFSSMFGLWHGAMLDVWEPGAATASTSSGGPQLNLGLTAPSIATAVNVPSPGQLSQQIHPVPIRSGQNSVRLDNGAYMTAPGDNLVSSVTASYEAGSGVQGITGIPQNNQCTLSYVVGGYPNLLTSEQASFEGGTTAGYSTTNCTIANSSAQALDGTKSLALTASAAGNIVAQSPNGVSGVPIVGGRTYQAIAFYRAATTGRTIDTQINWFNSAGSYLTTSDGVGATSTSSGWTSSTSTVAAPTGAAYASILALVIGAAGSGEIHYIDRISFQDITAPIAAVDGLQCCKVTATGGASWGPYEHVRAGAGATVVVAAGTQYTLSGWLTQGQGAYSVQARIEWRDSSFATISVSTGTAVVLSGTPQLASITATAPANTTNATVTFYATTTGVAGDYYYVDKVCFRAGSSTTFLDSYNGGIGVDVRIGFTPDAIQPTVAQDLIDKWLPTGNKRSWMLQLFTNGTLWFYASDTGSTNSAFNSTASLQSVGFADGREVAVRAFFNPDTGAAQKQVTFYYSTNNGGTWTQLGSTVTQATAMPVGVFRNDAPLVIGARGDLVETFDGEILWAELLDSINGGRVFRFDTADVDATAPQLPTSATAA